MFDSHILYLLYDYASIATINKRRKKDKNKLKIANWIIMNYYIHVSTGIKESSRNSQIEVNDANIGIECIREMIHYREKRGDFAMDVDIKDDIFFFSK